MADEVKVMLQQKRDAEKQVQASARAEADRRAAEHAELGSRLEPAMEIVKKVLEGAVAELRQFGYPQVDTQEMGHQGVWRGVALNVTIKNDPRKHTLRFYVEQGTIWCRTVPTEMGFYDHNDHPFSRVINVEHVNQLLPDAELRETVLLYLNRYIQALPKP